MRCIYANYLHKMNFIHQTKFFFIQSATVPKQLFGSDGNRRRTSFHVHLHSILNAECSVFGEQKRYYTFTSSDSKQVERPYCRFFFCVFIDFSVYLRLYFSSSFLRLCLICDTTFRRFIRVVIVRGRWALSAYKWNSGYTFLLFVFEIWNHIIFSSQILMCIFFIQSNTEKNKK